MTDYPWMSAGEAARLLGVSRTTLYAYVSRGYVRSQATAGPSRDRLYSRDDVDRLRRRTEARRDPDKAAARSLQWGLPVLESSIAFIDGRRLYYRGHEAVQLSRSRSVAEVASLIWSGRFDGVFSPAPPRRAQGASGRTGTCRSSRAHRRCLASASVQDHGAFDLRAGNVSHTGWRILHLLTRAAARCPRRRFRHDRAGGGRTQWGVKAKGVDVLRERAHPVRRPRAQRLVVHRPLRRIRRIAPLRRRHCGAGRAGRHQAWRCQRTRRVDAGLAAVSREPRAARSPRACAVESRSMASAIRSTGMAIRGPSRCSTCCAMPSPVRASWRSF